MNERRTFLIIRKAEDGLTVTVTPIPPAETALHFPDTSDRRD
ncbi:hypothetical protein [Brevundimonas diminuta]